jgi:CBS domain-containing protein
MRLIEEKTFIKRIHPFDNLDNQELEELTSNFDIIYFKKDEIIQNSSSNAEYLYFIIKGSVQEKDESEVITVFIEDEFFDPISLIKNNIKNSFIATTETICYSLSRDTFLEIIYKNEILESFFFQSISEKLNNCIVHEQNKELINFMIAKVKDAYYSKPLIIENLSIYETVSYMTSQKSSVVLIKNNNKIGIVTDSDFKEKVILKNIDVNEPISKIATFDILCVNENEFLFNAQLRMNKYGVKRLIIKDNDGNIIGILDLLSLTSFFASHTYSVMLQVDQATNIEELEIASKNYIKIIKALYIKGVKVRYISRLLSQLNNKLFSKLFYLIAPNGLKEQSNLIIMGSEGRGEQILRTDQDNALIISDNCQISNEKIEKFANDFSFYLSKFGYPKCPGYIMVSNPAWRLKYSEFKDVLHTWINSKDGKDLMNLAIFYDAVSVCGNGKLLEGLKDYSHTACNHNQAFHSHFAKSVLNFDTPLGFFANFIVSKKEHKNELDIKKGGIFPIVHGVRALSLEYDIKVTNTVDRLKELNNLEVIDRETTSQLIEAFNFLLTLRLKARLEKIDKNLELDNYVNPSSLTILQRDLLKDSFKIVDNFKKFLIYHYKLSTVI